MMKVTNPKTGRQIAVGGATWKKLLKEGLVEDERQLGEAKQGFELQQQIQELEEQTPTYQKVVKRGGKLVRKDKPVTQEAVHRLAAKKAAKLLKAAREDAEITEMQDSGVDIEKYLEKLLLEDMPKLADHNTRIKRVAPKKFEVEYEEAEDEPSCNLDPFTPSGSEDDSD